MVLAWSITEIIRYSFYAATKLQFQPRWLLWLRYNTFFVLYPLGAGSEAALIYSTLPSQTAWDTWAYVRAIAFGLWWPGTCVHSFAMEISQCFHGRSLRNVYVHD